MFISLKFVKRLQKKISLEYDFHPCPKCNHCASVRLIRSEKRFILFNKCIYNVMRVRYECSRCNWRNQELPNYSNNEI
ncbi:uncharacterized protein BX663DRAFT_525879 [Cokeromyces recurvatus]|uniref:uncharacterized protein n=1 Tax=Cokeromyces recurvatus TaxID=90255 RepID=UPI0022205290|nr:uncharacterized protein BX663DRAFT_525879 [Cokeromyces recurvatus]KAI7898157.1 hypothetical protein BX663DRAFT_525879 [Cokeromyces recurvatus]